MAANQSVLVAAPRLTLALEQIGPGDWLEFERFASEFLAPEYPSLRTTASSHGDRGRDGQMYITAEEPRTVVQYSVTTDWATKIRETVRRLSETLPSARLLIYATNQLIGPDADGLIAQLRRSKQMAIDIRDRSWFVEREATYPQRAIAASELAAKYVDPLLAERGVRSFAPKPLQGDEARVALLHLALEREDEATDKGWTKSCFEALVLSASHDTSADIRLTLPEIVGKVRDLLPAGHDAQIQALVTGALRRLSRRGGPIKEDRRDNSYALAYSEQQRLHAKMANYALNAEEVKKDLVTAVRGAAPRLKLQDSEWDSVADDLQFGLESVLLKRGEAFATAVITGEVQQIGANEILSAMVEAGRTTGSMLTDDEAATAIIYVLERPSLGVQAHLRRLADAYTMYAFLRQTPDVQKAVLSIFRGGELWLDTNVILPVLAETLIEDPTDRHYTLILHSALDAGLKLFVTDGVIEEVERHLNLCLTFARTTTEKWQSRVPFVYSAYALSGRARAEFVNWLEQFRGPYRPIDDVREYLAEAHAIDGRNLVDEAEQAPMELRAAVQEAWYAVHEQRRNRPDVELDFATMQRLVAHDVENTVGVMQLRQSSESPLGYHQWFLTLDKTALSLKRTLGEQFGRDSPDSPALSPDFMTQYLRLSRVRTAVEREAWANLPLFTDISRYEFMPMNLIRRADELRAEAADLDERVVRRRIRDQLDRMKLKLGPEALAGVRGMEERLKGRIRTANV